MLTLYTGTGGGENRAALFNAFVEQVRRGEKCLLLVPEQFTVHAEQEVFRLYGAGLGCDAEVVSFKRLCYRILLAAGRADANRLESGGRSVLMYRAFQSVRDHLNVYARTRPTSSFIAELLDMEEELARCNITHDAFMDAAAQVEQGDKLRELALILGTYTALLESSGAEPRTAAAMAAQALDDDGRLLEGVRLFVDGFWTFSVQEHALLARLMERCDVHVCLFCDGVEDQDGGYGVFSDIKATAKTLIHTAQQRRSAYAVRHCGRDVVHVPESLRRLSAALFTESPPYSGAPDGVALHLASDPFHEAEYAAAQIQRLVREDGLRYGEIAVLCRDQDQYRGVLDSVFRQYGIPVFTDKKTELPTKPLALFVRTALVIAGGDFTGDDVFTHIKTGLCDLDARQIGLLQRYHEIWNIAPAAWLRGGFTYHPDGFSDSAGADVQARLAEINRARDAVFGPLLRLQESLRGTPAARCAALYAFLLESRIPQKLQREAQALLAQGEPDLSQEAAQTWDVFMQVLDQLAAAGGEDPVDDAAFSELLLCALSTFDIGRIPTSLDEVLVGSVDRVRAVRVRAVFVLGVNEGEFPQNLPERGLLRDVDRRRLLGAGLELEPAADDRIFRERLYAYYAFSMPSERLFVLAHQLGADRREQTPSYFFSLLQSMFPGLAVTRDETFGADAVQDGASAFAALLGSPARYGPLRPFFEADPAYAGALARAQSLRAFGRGECARAPWVERQLAEGRFEASPTRIETFYRCRFAHFCRYILGVRRERGAKLDAPQTGTFIHHALEHILREVMEQDLWELDETALRARVELVTKRYLDGYLGGAHDKPARFRYLFFRLQGILESLVDSLFAELRQSGFVATDFELEIGADGSVASMRVEYEGGSVRVRGVADRVDVLAAEDGPYVRVVDYKSGAKQFQLDDVYNGLNMQMLIYLFSICEHGAARYGSNPRPAGILYYPADDSVLLITRGEPEEALEKQLKKRRRQNGLLLRNVEILEQMEKDLQGNYIPVKLKKDGGLDKTSSVTSEKGFAAIRAHVESLLVRMGREIQRGSVGPNPYKKGGYNSCQFCEYAAVCGYEPGRGVFRAFASYRDSDLKNAVEEADDE